MRNLLCAFGACALWLGTVSPAPADEPSSPVASLYREPLRPQYHFSAQRGWINDPNGLVYFHGQYHLFFQHSARTGEDPKSWGHAVGTDLVHWTQVDEALLPEPGGAMWSGSAVVDWKNSSGFGQDGNPPLVLIYTRAPIGNEARGQTCLAYSTDGLHFTKDADNPVLDGPPQTNRDPRVFWYEPGQHWVLTLYVEDAGHHNLRFYSSQDLRHWTQTSQLVGGELGHDGKSPDNFLYECPDLWEMPVEGSPGEKRWIVTAGNTEYLIGQFDGKTFTPETSKLPGQRGRGYYAPQTFNEEPQGRRVRFGWFQTDAPGMPFTQSMSLPSEHRLVRTAGGLRLTWSPVKELETLRTRTIHEGGITVEPGRERRFEAPTNLLEIRVECRPDPTGRTTFQVDSTAVLYDGPKKELAVGDRRVPVPLHDGRLDLIIYADRLSLEVYAQGGLVYVPLPTKFGLKPGSLVVSAEGEAVKFDRLDVYELSSIWPGAAKD